MTPGLKTYLSHLKGDKTIWALVALLAVFSFIPVYTASSNLAYLNGGSGNTLSYLLKHFAHLSVGFVFMFLVHKIPFRYFKGLSLILIPIVIILLAYTLFQGTTIGGANASRWIQVPIVNMSFQTSSLASLVLMVYVAKYLAKTKDETVTLKSSFLPLWLPVFMVIALILPANFSTAFLVGFGVFVLAFVGGYPKRNLLAVLGIAIAGASIFVLTAFAFPSLFPNRVDTWKSRIENFSSGESTQEQYQVEKAKIAIASGGVAGNGIGKSVQRNFLPQSSSDFIYAIIIEEMGLIGGFGVMLAYLILLYRIAIITTKTEDVFGKLVVVAVGFPIILQAFINMGVAVELFPVTGQTLPLISSGGTSIWMTCLAVGIIQSVKAGWQTEKEEEQIPAPDSEMENPLDVLSETI